jgi:hypothetical protein
MKFNEFLNFVLTGNHDDRTSNLVTADVQFRRKTNRYAHKGTFSSNKGYLSVARCVKTGKFISTK